MNEKLPIFWNSATHRGSIRRLTGTTADGVVHDLGIWSDATVKKTGTHESALPYDSLATCVGRLAEKYAGFRLVSDVVQVFMEKEE